MSEDLDRLSEIEQRVADQYDGHIDHLPSIVSRDLSYLLELLVTRKSYDVAKLLSQRNGYKVLSERQAEETQMLQHALQRQEILYAQVKDLLHDLNDEAQEQEQEIQQLHRQLNPNEPPTT